MQRNEERKKSMYYVGARGTIGTFFFFSSAFGTYSSMPFRRWDGMVDGDSKTESNSPIPFPLLSFSPPPPIYYLIAYSSYLPSNLFLTCLLTCFLASWLDIWPTASEPPY